MGILRFHPPFAVTFESLDGKVYALNGAAKHAGFPDVREIWRDDPNGDEGSGAKVVMTPMIEMGLEMGGVK